MNNYLLANSTSRFNFLFLTVIFLSLSNCWTQGDQLSEIQNESENEGSPYPDAKLFYPLIKNKIYVYATYSGEEVRADLAINDFEKIHTVSLGVIYNETKETVIDSSGAVVVKCVSNGTLGDNRTSEVILPSIIKKGIKWSYCMYPGESDNDKIENKEIISVDDSITLNHKVYKNVLVISDGEAFEGGNFFNSFEVYAKNIGWIGVKIVHYKKQGSINWKSNGKGCYWALSLKSIKISK